VRKIAAMNVGLSRRRERLSRRRERNEFRFTVVVSATLRSYWPTEECADRTK
jgi:hypothetical protein